MIPEIGDACFSALQAALWLEKGEDIQEDDL